MMCPRNCLNVRFSTSSAYSPARGIAIADQVRARIAECTDPDLLERGATRAATCSTIDEVFAS
jgi:hypothetical protein